MQLNKNHFFSFGAIVTLLFLAFVIVESIYHIELNYSLAGHVPKRKAFIHIGPHKTGSSAIQKFFETNAAAIKESTGISWPTICGNNAKKFTDLALECRNNMNMTPPRYFSTCVNGSFPIMLRKYLDDSTGDIFISSETLSWDCSSDGMQYIKQLFQGFDVHIIAFFRSYPDHLVSLYKEFQKRRCFPKDLEVLASYHLPEGFYLDKDYIAMLSNIFGANNVHLISYEGSKENVVIPILNDVLKLGRNQILESLIEEMAEANVSGSLECFSLVKAMNQVRKKNNNNDFTSVFSSLKELIELRNLLLQEYGNDTDIFRQFPREKLTHPYAWSTIEDLNDLAMLYRFPKGFSPNSFNEPASFLVFSMDWTRQDLIASIQEASVNVPGGQDMCTNP